MKATITNKTLIAEGTLQVTFTLEEPFSFIPGQYTFVTLPELLYPDERSNKRQFSITNTPKQKGIVTIATRTRESGFKRTLNELPVGAEVEVGPIAGRFTLPDQVEKPFVFIAGGIGITPFISMLRHINQEGLPFTVTLLYTNKNKSQTAFFDELKEIEQVNSRIKVVFIMTQDESWEGEKRHIDANLIKEYFPKVNDLHYYIAGPPGMVTAIRQGLEEAGVEKENVTAENFSGY